MKKILASLMALIMIFGLFAGLPVFAEEENTELAADLPADRYDPEVEPRSEANENNPLVIASQTMDGKFSPFFYTSEYDRVVYEYTQIFLASGDKDGYPIANIDEPSYAYEIIEDVKEDNSASSYKYILKNGLTFSDGEPVTVQDALFSLYVLCDPAYDGIATIYTLPIVGIQEYRLQASTEQIELTNAIIEAGVEAEAGEEGAVVPVAAEGVDPEAQAAFWAHLPEAGKKFAQEIIDYVFNNYAGHIDKYMAPFTAEDLETNENVKNAYGMVMWGFGEVAEDGKFTDAMGNEYDLAADTVDSEVYWNNLVDAYGYNFDSEEGINAEMAGETSIEDYVKKEYMNNEGAAEGEVTSIAGVTTGKEVCEDGVERDYILFELNGIDPTALFKLNFAIMPAHYYTEKFEGELNENMVSIDNPEFMQALKEKNNHPMGAGPYIFESYENNIVNYIANDNYLMGAPKIKHLRIMEISAGSEMDSLKTGTVHWAEPSATPESVNEISKGEGDLAKIDYILVDNDGYGYIGINGQAIPELGIRAALAHAMNVQLTVDEFYGELASANYRNMSKVVWAYPENPENVYPYDETGETSKQLFLDNGYAYDEEKNVMTYPEDHEKAGEPVTVKFTLPSEAKDHPAGVVALDFQNILSKIGVEVEIEVDNNLLNKLSTAYESGLQIWAAAWGGGGIDPDMFQVWHSDPAVNNANSPNSRGLYWLYTNGSEENKELLTEMNELIIAGRLTLDREERRQIYDRALELASLTATQIPTYQRKNMYGFNKEVINADTLITGDDVTPFQGPLAEIWKVEFVD